VLRQANFDARRSAPATGAKPRSDDQPPPARALTRAMGRRRAKATKVVKKKQPTMQTEFKCPFCNYEKCVAAKMDYDKETGTLECRVCAATYTATINYLSEPVDVFSEWIDQCEAEDEERAKRDAARDRGEDVEEDAPAPKRTRIDFADPAEDEAEVDPNDDPALHAGL
jgi:transcription elongation factor Elf1